MPHEEIVDNRRMVTHGELKSSHFMSTIFDENSDHLM